MLDLALMRQLTYALGLQLGYILVMVDLVLIRQLTYVLVLQLV